MINLSANTLFILSKMDTDSTSPIVGNIPSNLLILHDPLQRQDHYLMQVPLCHCLHLHTTKQVSHKRPLCTKETNNPSISFRSSIYQNLRQVVAVNVIPHSLYYGS